MSFSYASVIEVIRLSPRLIRITLQVNDAAALSIRPGGDSAVGVYFPTETNGARALPPIVAGVDGTLCLDPDADAEGRNYTVRHHIQHPDGDRIDLDIFLHARGIATEWALSTHAGERVGLDHARSWYRPPPNTDWQLLVADLSGLPAAARIIAELPGGTPVTAVVEISDPEDLEYLPRHRDVTVVPSIGTGNGHTASRLAELVGQLTAPAGSGYCWFAGEAAESRAVRKHFRGLGWTIDQLDVTGYWRFDSEKWDARYAAVADAVEAVWVRAMEAGKGERAADEEFDEALERVGL